MKQNPTKLKTVARLIEVERQLEKLRKLYSERQELIEELIGTDQDIFETPSHVLMLTDNFEDKITAFRTTSFCRYAIAIQKKHRRKK